MNERLENKKLDLQNEQADKYREEQTNARNQDSRYKHHTFDTTNKYNYHVFDTTSGNDMYKYDTTRADNNHKYEQDFNETMRQAKAAEKLA